MTKNKADLNRVIWKNEWCWLDAISTLDEESKEAFMSLSEKEKKELMDECEHSIEKGMEYGIMEYWGEVMKTAVQESGLIGSIREIIEEKENK